MGEDEKVRETFKGVFALNEYIRPSSLVKPSAYIINTGRLGTPGIHWVAIFFNGCEVFYFDSLAITPLSYPEIYSTINRFCPIRIFTMPHRIQGIGSSVCGHYCIYFLQSIMSGVNFHKFISYFSRYNMSKNDERMCRYIATNYPYADHYCKNII